MRVTTWIAACVNRTINKALHYSTHDIHNNIVHELSQKDARHVMIDFMSYHHQASHQVHYYLSSQSLSEVDVTRYKCNLYYLKPSVINHKDVQNQR